MDTPDDNGDNAARLIADARLLLEHGTPWIAPAVRGLDVAVTGDRRSSTREDGRVLLAVDAAVADAETQGVPAVNIVAVHLLVCAWRVLLDVDTRYRILDNAGDQWAWQTAADAVCCRAAATTGLTTPAGVRYLTRATGMVTPRSLGIVDPDPDTIELVELYTQLRKDPDDPDDSDDSDGDDDAAGRGSGVPEAAFTVTAPPAKDGECGTTPDPELEALRDQVAGELAGRVERGDDAPAGTGSFAMGRGRVRLDLDREFRNAVAGFVSAADPGPRASYLRPPRVDDPSLILPGRAAVTRRIMVAMDTSPSMRGAQLTAAAQAVSTVADSRTMIVDYLSVDREAGPVRRLHRGGEVIVDRMSGGTDMRMALEEIDRSRPVGGVVITDGETPWPEVAPVTRNLLIVIVPPAGEPERVTRNRAYTTQMACPWARVTVLPA
jgi:hypothetical protein